MQFTQTELEGVLKAMDKRPFADKALNTGALKAVVAALEEYGFTIIDTDELNEKIDLNIDRVARIFWNGWELGYEEGTYDGEDKAYRDLGFGTW